MSAVSNFELTELFTAEIGRSRLGELEDRVLTTLQRSTDESDALAEWGIEPLRVGVARVVLPEETTRSVFERMKATQQRLAAEAESRGEAAANTIVDSAFADATRIRAFAERRAEEIRVRGDREATPYLERLSEEEDLAVFLENLAFLREFFGRRATLLLSTDMPGLEVFRQDMLERVGQNGLPRFGIDPASEQSESAEGDE
jgi:regulator of protease activity HflC (stomatin/prohibitin superfamily)